MGFHGESAWPAVCAAAVSLLLAACGNGVPDAPAAVAVPACPAGGCDNSALVTQLPSVTSSLCPASLGPDTVFTGGSGSGEYIKLSFDSQAKHYSLTFVESPVPRASGEVNETRAGLTIRGSYETADRYRAASTGNAPAPSFVLPTAEQNRCAFVLKDGRTDDGRYAVSIDPRDPPIVFVGNGIAGGTIPGATIQFDGIPLAPGILVGTVPRKTFDYYPFISFSKTVTDFSRVAGDYHELGIRFTPEGGSFQTSPEVPTGSPLGWQVDAVQVSETFRADGSCSEGPADSPAACKTTGMNWRLRMLPDGSPDNVFISDAPPLSGSVYPAVGEGLMQAALTRNDAHGIMIVGEVDGALVPIMVRVGYAHAGASFMESTLDDQVGISMLAPARRIEPTARSSAYIGATSASACGFVSAYAPTTTAFEGACLDEASTRHANVNYVSTVFEGANAALFDPFAARASANFTLDYTQQAPGLVRVTAQNPLLSGNTAIFKRGDTGLLIQSGSVFALLMNGSGRPNPFFTIGAFVQ